MPQGHDELGQFMEGGDYTAELAERICAEIIDGKSVRTICKMEGMPDRATVVRWLRKHEDFKALYDRACIERAEAYAEEIIDIADDGSNDYVPDGDGHMRFDSEHVQRSKLRVDSRKWICAKMKPKKYGEKLAVGGAEDLPPVQVQKIERVLVRADAKNRDG